MVQQNNNNFLIIYAIQYTLYKCLFAQVYRQTRFNANKQIGGLHLFDSVLLNWTYIISHLESMKKKTQKALVIEEYGGKITLQEIPMPELDEGEVLIKVDASTINPSDHLLMDGACFERPLPSICGIEGTGTVVDAVGELAKLWIGVRVSFISPSYGSWVEYSVATPHEIFEIDDNIPISSSACGLINPLTAIGFVERFRATKCKFGMINTAAASSLGRMLIKLCERQNIPLLNIVRREEHKEILQKAGAKHIIVTTNGWEKEYKYFIEKYKFDCLFDALGGGPVNEALIAGLLPNSRVYIYGALEGKPIVVSSAIQYLRGLTIEGFLIFSWWGRCSEEFQEEVRNKLNAYLTKELSTHVVKEIYFEQIDEGIELSIKKCSEGKVILRMNKD